MWEKPWKYKEGFAVCGALMLVGLLLQWVFGPVAWSLVERPYNLILLVLLIFFTILGHALSSRFYVLEWMSKATAAVPTLLSVSVLLLVMGFTRQVGPYAEPTDALGLTRMVGFWPFVLVSVYAVFQVGLTVMTTVMRWRMGTPLWRALLFGSSHLGLWLALVCATLGSSDMIRVMMVAQEGVTDNQGVDERHRLVALPFTVKLEDFGIDLYPADGAEEARPRRYYSAVTVHTKRGQTLQDTIEVNRPLRIHSWWIYQTGYDEAAGPQSKISILQMVRDPWIHSIYVGFIMMLVGAVLLLLPKNRVTLWRSGLTISLMAVVAFAFIYVTLVSVGYFERKMMPALQSPWFGPHIVVYMVGYSCLALATVAAIVRRQAVADLLVRPGLSFLTFGMLFGAFWAKEAWGTYWSWDPKETWAAATWLLYVAYLHLRASRPKSLNAATVLLFVAFLCLQMCWWGVNYLPSAQATSIHTYTS